jgi:hypothetical protein
VNEVWREICKVFVKPRGNYEMQRAAESLVLRVDTVEVHTSSDLGGAFTKAERSGSQAVVLTNHGMFRSAAAAAAELAIEHHLPLFSPYAELAEEGALLAWVPSFVRWSELAARHLARVFPDLQKFLLES